MTSFEFKEQEKYPTLRLKSTNVAPGTGEVVSSHEAGGGGGGATRKNNDEKRNDFYFGPIAQRPGVRAAQQTLFDL